MKKTRLFKKYTTDTLKFLIDSFLKNNTKQFLITIAPIPPELGGLPKRKRLEFRG